MGGQRVRARPERLRRRRHAVRLGPGLRIFNIQDPLHPREVAYFVSPPKAGSLDGTLASDLAMSQPAFDPARRQVWYTDASSGFWDVQLTNGVWPDATSIPASQGSGKHRATKHRKTKHRKTKHRGKPHRRR